MYCLLALTTLTFFSCQKDTDNLPADTKNLIGTWETPFFNYIEGQEDIRIPEATLVETEDGTPFRLEINDNNTFQATGDGVVIAGTYTAERAKGKYGDGTKFNHGDLSFNFITPNEDISTTDSLYIVLLKEIDTYNFNGESLTISSNPGVDGGWSKVVLFEKR